MAQENDIVLIYFEDNPVLFARIEDIQPDIKPDWYHVTLLMLQVPLQVVTWILRNAYINGDEFTMNGKRIRMELVECPDSVPDFGDEEDDDLPEKEDRPAGGRAKVISFESIRKR